MNEVTNTHEAMALPPLNLGTYVFTIIGSLILPSFSMLLYMLSTNLSALMLDTADGVPVTYHWNFHLHVVLLATIGYFTVAVTMLTLRATHPDLMLRATVRLKHIATSPKNLRIAAWVVVPIIVCLTPGGVLIALALLFSGKPSK